MFDKSGTIIYVGKAKNLKKRVSSYFRDQLPDLKTAYLVSQIARIETIVTHTENEALILENQLIKTHWPKYNILLKDDKNYPYIKVTVQEPFPKILVVRQVLKDGARYYGPYPFLGSAKWIQHLLYSVFPLRDCKQAISTDSLQKKCLKLDMKTCLGPCVIKDVKSEYDHYVQQLHLLLTGRSQKFIHVLEQDMTKAAAFLQFERAARLRDGITKIKAMAERQSVDLKTRENSQIWTYALFEGYQYMLVQSVIDGKLLYQKGYYETVARLSKIDFIQDSFIAYQDEIDWKVHDLICEDEIAAAIQPLLGTVLPSFNPKLVSPKIGNRRQLLDLATKNAHFAAARIAVDEKKKKIDVTDTLEHLQKVCGLSRIPRVIFGFDISHLSGTGIVASCVVFENGIPKKSAYRRFNIRSVQGESNDPKSMYEVVLRRLHRAMDEDDLFPDLLLIDGGRGQLNFSAAAMLSLPLKQTIDLISLAKKNEEIYRVSDSEPLRLSRQDSGLKLLQRVRDEAHRFAVNFQRSKRGKWEDFSEIAQIPGLGKSRLAALRQSFRSVEEISNSSIEELARVGNMGSSCAQKIKIYLQAI